MSRLTRLVSGAPVPVFAATGVDGWGVVQELRADARIRLATSPRHAAVLLVAGAIPPEHGVALRQVHDQLPRPRTVVAWRAGPGEPVIPPAITVNGGADDAVLAVTSAFGRLLADPAAATSDLLPDEEPNEWRGVGPFGQGGQGMMGGTPYGRPMAMTGDDRDGLALDQLRLRLGPFLDQLPPGLVLDVTLQGEVLQDVTLHRAGVVVQPAAERAVSESAARRGLRWLTHALHVEGLDALAARTARLGISIAERPDTAPSAAIRLIRHVDRCGVLWTLRGIGVHNGSDAADRWRRRLAAIAAALGHRDAVAAAPSTTDDRTIAALLTGMTLTDAVSTLVSLEPRDERATART